MKAWAEQKISAVQIMGDQEQWEARLLLWDYELTGEPGRLKSTWKRFVRPFGYSGPGTPYTNEPSLIRFKTGGLRGWIMMQNGGMDI